VGRNNTWELTDTKKGASSWKRERGKSTGPCNVKANRKKEVPKLSLRGGFYRVFWKCFLDLLNRIARKNGFFKKGLNRETDLQRISKRSIEVLGEEEKK